MNTSAASIPDRSEQIVRNSFARFDIRALGITSGLLVGALIWLVTATLLIKGAAPDAEVGPHLGLLAHYFPGFSVSWLGSVLGLLYGFVLGFGCGAVIGIAWNLSHYIFVMRASGKFGPAGNL